MTAHSRPTLSLAAACFAVAAVASHAAAANVRLSGMPVKTDTHAFAAGDVFIIDQAFAPKVFKATCPGDLTVRVEGGAVSPETALDFSGVQGRLTLSSLGTEKTRLPSPRLPQNVVLESCWFSAVTLDAPQGGGGALVAAGVGALGDLDAFSAGKAKKATTLTVSGTQSLTSLKTAYNGWGNPTLALTIANAATLTAEGDFCSAEVALQVNGTLDCKRHLVSTDRNYRTASLNISSGGTVRVAGNFYYGCSQTHAATQTHTVTNKGTLEIGGTLVWNSRPNTQFTSTGTLVVGGVEHRRPFADTFAPVLGGIVKVNRNVWCTADGAEGSGIILRDGTTLILGTDLATHERWRLEGEVTAIVPPKAALVFSGEIGGTGCLNLAQNKGTVILAHNRPTLSALGGELLVAPTGLLASEIRLPLRQPLAALPSGVTFIVDAQGDWSPTLKGKTLLLRSTNAIRPYRSGR